jgi:hypothetical protein
MPNRRRFLPCVSGLEYRLAASGDLSSLGQSVPMTVSTPTAISPMEPTSGNPPPAPEDPLAPVVNSVLENGVRLFARAVISDTLGTAVGNWVAPPG